MSKITAQKETIFYVETQIKKIRGEEESTIYVGYKNYRAPILES